MAGEVFLDAAGVQRVESDMQNSINNLRNFVKEVDDEVQAIKGSGWDGNANQEFTKASGDWQDEATQLNSKLNRLQDAVTAGKGTIQKMDQGGLHGDASGGGGAPLTNL
ncbi:WXG100 family type VII secretion target [Nocardia sp. NPDC051570]|uniref:WXG100 family type VII secretion target n=1 Tax=Nocardia sp. NPDC051570 TaxID=3364324 RepID=UPI0037AB4A79